MTLKDELLALKPLLGTDSPEFYTKMREIAAKYNSEEDKKLLQISYQNAYRTLIGNWTL